MSVGSVPAMRSDLEREKERENFSRRLREALTGVGEDGESPTRLAREFNRRYPGTPITLHAARKWLQGDAIPAQDKLRVLAEWCGVAAEWLRYGGENAETRTAQIVGRAAGEEVDYDLARQIGALSPAHQNAVRALVRALRRAETPD